MLIIAISVLVLVIAGYAIAKNYDAKVVLFAAGFVLMVCAVIMGNVKIDPKLAAGNVWFFPLTEIKSIFIKQYSTAGLIIMVLFGFSAYMSHIGANNAVIAAMSRPIKLIKSPYILVPVVFWLGTALSVVVPSASSLAVILMATLYPVLRATGMSPLTAGGVIATTATIAPTPLGGDNVVAAQQLGIEHVVDYVVVHHARISLPVIAFMGFVHYFWQKFMDKKEGKAAFTDIDESKLEKMDNLPPLYYGIFPVLPLVIILILGIFFKQIKVGIVEITLFCFVLSVVVEIIRKRQIQSIVKDCGKFFNGMGNGFSQVVVLIVAAGTMVAGLKAIGFVDLLADSVKNFQNAGMGLMFAFSGITALITFISGSGNAVFYSFIELIPPIAKQAGVNPIMVALPMQFTSNLIRAVSPVSAVVIIVASVMQVNPLQIVKRTSVPLLAGFVLTMIISVIVYS